MPISGVVIKCLPGCAEDLAQALNRPGAVEIKHVVDRATLIAVIEAPSVSEEVELTKQLLAEEGVVSVQLAYHNFEDIVP